MLLPIKAICDRRAKKDGTSVINIQYCYSSEKRTVLPTEINIPSAYWNKKQQLITAKMPVSFGNADELNDKLRLLLRRTEDLVLLAKKYEADGIVTLKDYFGTTRSLAEVEALLKKKQDNVNAEYTNLDFFFQVDDYIRSQTVKVSGHMPAIYRNMKMHLQEFEKFRKSPITFDGLNYTFYEGLVEYLSYNYVHKRRYTKIKGLKKILLGRRLNSYGYSCTNGSGKNSF